MRKDREWVVAVGVFEKMMEDLHEGKERTRTLIYQDRRYAVIIEKECVCIQPLIE